MISLHDHFVRELSVDADEKQIRLRTAFPKRSGPSFAEATFEGVEAYVLLGDALGTILLDVEEVDPIALYESWKEPLRARLLASGGHAPWVEKTATASRFITDKHLKGFAITSSIGLEGAVWAASLSVR